MRQEKFIFCEEQYDKCIKKVINKIYANKPVDSFVTRMLEIWFRVSFRYLCTSIQMYTFDVTIQNLFPKFKEEKKTRIYVENCTHKII